MRLQRARWACALLGMALSAAAGAADPLPVQTRLVAASNAPAATEREFDIATAADLTVTLTDFQLPAALASASIVITQGDVVAGRASLAPPATSATVNLAAALGHYTLRVIGAPDAAYSVGTFSVCVAPSSDPAACIQGASLAGNVTAQGSAADPSVSTASLDIEVTTAGSYSVAFSDHQFPAPLAAAPNLALFQGSVPIGLGIASGTVFNLSPGRYTLLSIAQADPALKAGLYGVSISGAATVLDDTFLVGTIPAPQTPGNPAAQSLTLTVRDYAFPFALSNAAALVTVGSAKLATAAAGAGPVALSAPATGPGSILKLWTFATPGSGAGTYDVSLAAASSNLLYSARGVPSGNEQAFAFVTPSLTTGPYQLGVKDFEFPAILPNVRFQVLQGGLPLASASVAGTADFTAVDGPALVLVAAQAPAGGNGLVGITVSSAGTSPLIVFDKAQGVSSIGLFDSQDITLGTSGGFDATLADLQFPSRFQDLALVVSRGGAVVGKIFGGGTFSINATPGTYQLTFVATPAAAQSYGLYAVKVVAAAPTVTLTATPASLVEGEATTLTWTSADAETCTGSGGSWSGSKTINSGTEAVHVDKTTTFTLTCTGPGGTTAATATVTATAKPASSGGGGGSLDPYVLLALAGMLTARLSAAGSARRR